MPSSDALRVARWASRKTASWPASSSVRRTKARSTGPDSDVMLEILPSPDDLIGGGAGRTSGVSAGSACLNALRLVCYPEEDVTVQCRPLPSYRPDHEPEDPV